MWKLLNTAFLGRRRKEWELTALCNPLFWQRVVKRCNVVVAEWKGLQNCVKNLDAGVLSAEIIDSVVPGESFLAFFARVRPLLKLFPQSGWLFFETFLTDLHRFSCWPQKQRVLAFTGLLLKRLLCLFVRFCFDDRQSRRRASHGVKRFVVHWYEPTFANNSSCDIRSTLVVRIVVENFHRAVKFHFDHNVLRSDCWYLHLHELSKWQYCACVVQHMKTLQLLQEEMLMLIEGNSMQGVRLVRTLHITIRHTNHQFCIVLQETVYGCVIHIRYSQSFCSKIFDAELLEKWGNSVNPQHKPGYANISNMRGAAKWWQLFWKNHLINNATDSSVGEAENALWLKRMGISDHNFEEVDEGGVAANDCKFQTCYPAQLHRFRSRDDTTIFTALVPNYSTLWSPLRSIVIAERQIDLCRWRLSTRTILKCFRGLRIYQTPCTPLWVLLSLDPGGSKRDSHHPTRIIKLWTRSAFTSHEQCDGLISQSGWVGFGIWSTVSQNSLYEKCLRCKRHIASFGQDSTDINEWASSMASSSEFPLPVSWARLDPTALRPDSTAHGGCSTKMLSSPEIQGPYACSWLDLTQVVMLSMAWETQAENPLEKFSPEVSGN